MAPVNPPPFPLREHQIEIRVRYQETDAQGHVHHATYVNYFELGRVEMLRAAGYSYRQMEDEGMMLVVTELGCEYFFPASYDDLLRLVTTVVRGKGVRIEHQYQLFRKDVLLARGRTVVACVGKDGKVKRLPQFLRIEPPSGRLSPANRAHSSRRATGESRQSLAGGS